jgi:hypothetical protein
MITARKACNAVAGLLSGSEPGVALSRPCTDQAELTITAVPTCTDPASTDIEVR